MVRLTALALLACLLPACTSMPDAMPANEATFVIVRHAEKVADAGDDPSLTDAGRARAEAIAASLADAPVVAVYSTAFARTQETARPAATTHALPVTTYDAREPADALAIRLRAAHDTGTVLVVGHSNTVPAIAAALCHCEVPAMEETEYDRHLRVTIDADGQATLATGRLPAADAP